MTAGLKIAHIRTLIAAAYFARFLGATQRSYLKAMQTEFHINIFYGVHGFPVFPSFKYSWKFYSFYVIVH